MPEIEKTLRVFISHCSKDQSIARDLYFQLNAEGWMDVWFIESNLKPSQNWDLEIRSAIENTDVVIVLLTKNSTQKESYIYPDSGFVLDILQSEQKKEILVIPLRFDTSDVPANLGALEAIIYFPKSQRRQIYPTLLERLKLYAKQKGFSLDRRTLDLEPEQGLQWSPTIWKEQGGLFGEDVIDDEVLEQKPIRPHSKLKMRIFSRLNNMLYFTLTIGVLLVLLVIGLVVNFVNTGETLNTVAEPIISKILLVIPLPTPTLGVGSARVSPVDGMRMVYVPAGEFIMGSDEGADDEKPARSVSLDAYWIDQFEVTNGMYKMCVDAGVCRPPNYREANEWFRLEIIPFVGPIARFYDDPQYENYPISRITWDDANSYCTWVGRRLPTEAEWEKAARGTDGRTYPWGENASCTYANVYAFPADEACAYAPTRIGSYENGISPFGVYDMAGNVFEFVSDIYELKFEPAYNTPLDFSFNFRLRKGGSWITSGQVARSANREIENPLVYNFDPNSFDYFDPDGENGFRCAVSSDAPTPQTVHKPAPTREIIAQVSAIDEMPMIYVPAGEFIMGSDYFEEDEKPAHNVYLDAFWIDQYEVTNGMYAKCFEAKRCGVPLRYYSPVPIFNSNQQIVGYQYNNDSKFFEQLANDPDLYNQPVTDIFWENAHAYCHWAGRRLPTEAEWEKAARGVDGRTYPWGEHVDCTKANFYSCEGSLSRVGSYETGQSPYGAYDMAGNAMEWVADWYDNTYYQLSPYQNPLGPESGLHRVFRGGSWGNDHIAGRSTNRPGYMANIPNDFIGFRCATSGEAQAPQSSNTPVPTREIVSQVLPVDRTNMVFVPAGEFVMGGDAYFEEQPIHQVILDAFWIDKTEVTNAMFAEFLNQWGIREEGGEAWLDTTDEDVRIHLTDGIWRSEQAYENHPVVEVTWFGANAYCAWAGRRLPTEAEWEKSARGIHGNIFPWGNKNPTPDLLNFNNNFGDTTKVGSYPQGASPYGALDMAGNVWEWVADRHSRTYYSNSPLENPPGPEAGFFRVLRGGGWNYRDTYVRSIHRNRGAPTISHDFVGFRCASPE